MKRCTWCKSVVVDAQKHCRKCGHSQFEPLVEPGIIGGRLARACLAIAAAITSVLSVMTLTMGPIVLFVMNYDRLDVIATAGYLLSGLLFFILNTAGAVTFWTMFRWYKDLASRRRIFDRVARMNLGAAQDAAELPVGPAIADERNDVNGS